MVNIPITGSTKWNRNSCNYVMTKTLEDELDISGITRSVNNWNLYFPCTYDNMSDEVNRMPIVDNAKYFILENGDIIVAKEWLWKNVVEHYGYNKAVTLLPNSYILYNPDDIKRFDKEYDSKKIYIMKKNMQRQEGLKITNDKSEIINGFKNGYILVQELLQNPYTISNRKTNMRVYLLVVCKGNNTDVYIYNDGFMYYTKDFFKKNSLEDGPNITTGYIDRKVYEENPLTHGDLKKYLDNPERKDLLPAEKYIKNQGLKISEVYFDRIYNAMRDIIMAFVGKISISANGKKKFNDTNITFQLFGADVGVNEDLCPIIMEINKGPDLGTKDERDSILKHGVVKDTLKIIGAVKSDIPHDFTKILSVENGKITQTCN